jgi:hypothetical protein
MGRLIEGRTIMKMIPKTRFVPYVYECLPQASRAIAVYTKGKADPADFEAVFMRSLDAVLRASVTERLFRCVTDAIFLVPERPRRRALKSSLAPPVRQTARGAKSPQNGGQGTRRTRVFFEKPF